MTEQQRDTEADGWTGTAEEWLLIGPLTLWVQIAAESEHENGKESMFLHFSFGHTQVFY